MTSANRPGGAGRSPQGVGVGVERAEAAIESGLVSLNGNQVHAFALDAGNLGLHRLTDLLTAILDSGVWRAYRTGIGTFRFCPGEFDYFLSTQGIIAADVAFAARDLTVAARLEEAMDSRRTGEPGYRRSVVEVCRAVPALPGRPITSFDRPTTALDRQRGSSPGSTVAAIAATGLPGVGDYLQAARATGTRKAYASDWVHFTDWCDTQTDDDGAPFTALPASPDVVALYLAEHAGALKVASLIRRCSAISSIHQAAGHPSPTQSPLVRTTLAGIRRVHGTAATAKDPLLAHQVRRLLDALPREEGKTLLAARDRCLLTLGFYGALRRSELVALDVDDVEVNDQGLVVTLRRSKTDQDGTGRRIAMLHTGSADSCPAEVYQAWRTLLADLTVVPAIGDDQAVVDARPKRQPVFRPITRHGHVQATRLTDRAVARIVQRTALRAGLGDMDLAGHSLRAGFATSAAAAGKSERSIMKQTGHKSLPMVRRYIREGSLFRDNATDGLTL